MEINAFTQLELADMFNRMYQEANTHEDTLREVARRMAVIFYPNNEKAQYHFIVQCNVSGLFYAEEMSSQWEGNENRGSIL